MSEPRGYQRLFAELKRRHVFRVMAMYGAVGFIILQSVELVIPALLLPEWTYRLVALILLIGFPISIVLAWSFDVSPEGGLQRTPSASAEEIASIAAAPASSRWPIGVAALAGTVLLGLGGWWVLGRNAGVEAEDQVYDSIAVLPFVNMTGQEGVEYLGEGLAEELRNALVRIEGLKIPSMTSAAAFGERGADIRMIGDSLGVDLVLEGSVRGSGNQLRVTAQLIDAEDDHHVWSDTYDRPVGDDLLALQTELTERIVAALSNELDTGKAGSVAARGTDDTEAYDLYLKGRHFWNKRTFDDMQVAIGLFKDAIEIDSSYAPAYAAIADAYAVPSGWGDDPGHALDEAQHYARRALELDPALAEAHTALAFTYGAQLQFRQAEASYARAIELDDGYATAHQWFAELLAAMGRDEEAVKEVRKAEALDPTPIIRWNVARVLYFVGRYEEALEQLDRVAGQDQTAEDEGRFAYMYGVVLWALDDFDRLAELVERAPLDPDAPEGAVDMQRRIAETLRTAPEPEARLFIARLLDQAGNTVEGPGGWAGSYAAALAWMPIEPDSALARLGVIAEHSDETAALLRWFDILADASFDPLRDDLRFQELNARFGL